MDLVQFVALIGSTCLYRYFDDNLNDNLPRDWISQPDNDPKCTLNEKRNLSSTGA